MLELDRNCDLRRLKIALKFDREAERVRTASVNLLNTPTAK